MANPIGQFSPDSLFCGAFYPVTDWLSIPSGTYPRGTIVKVDGSGFATTQAPFAILAEDVDASAAAVVAPVYKTGEFNINKVLLANGNPVSAPADIAALRAISIFVKKPVAYPAS